jgi:DNA-binding CsgD family transcriptional regulator
MTAEIACIAALPDGIGERATALLAPLRRLTRFDAAHISLFDHGARRIRSVARCGYPERVQRFFDSSAMVDSVERAGMREARSPVQIKDLPVPPDTLQSWAEYERPAGFGNGLAVPLSTSDGRYLGLFAAHTEAAAPLDAATCALLADLAPLLAHALDPLRAPAALAALVADAAAGAVLTRADSTVALPGLPGHPLLTVGSPVLAAARGRLTAESAHSVFLSPQPPTGTDPGSGLLRVTVLACPPQPASDLQAVVLLSPPPDLRGLTRRELCLLGLLVQGWTNARIAAALTITARTVAAHVEHILVKLAATSRTMAAVRAERQGLYIPADLTGTDRTIG